MNIAMIASALPSSSKNGAGYQAHYMANAFVCRGHKVTMFTPAPRPVDALYEIRHVPVGLSLRTFRFAWSLSKADFTGFDVIHAHGDDYWLWRRRTPVHIRTMHGACLNEAFHIPGVKEKIRMLLLGATEAAAAVVADRTVAVSRNTLKSYPWIKHVVPNGVDLTEFKPGPKEPEPTLLFVGTYRNRKRGKFLTEVFVNEVVPRIPAAKLWMVCSDAPVKDRVHVLGELTTKELASRYRRAWAFCLPSTYEGFGVPYIEAMASGTAVIATPNPGAREVLADGQYGRVVKDQELGATIVNVLENERSRVELATQGIARAKEYGWETVVSKYEGHYNEILKQHNMQRTTDV